VEFGEHLVGGDFCPLSPGFDRRPLRRLLRAHHRLPRVTFRAYYAPKTSAGTTRWKLGAGCGGSGWSDTSRLSARTRSTCASCRKLTVDDLKELGVAAIGHRRLLLKAIADLAVGAGRAAEDVPAASPANATADAERRQSTAGATQPIAPIGVRPSRRRIAPPLAGVGLYLTNRLPLTVSGSAVAGLVG
jgi:hypothetical protein